MNASQLNELLLQSLEAELGGVQVYEAAIGCALNPDLRTEWEHYLGETRTHVTTLREVCRELGIDADQETPGRLVIRHIGESLLEAIRLASEEGGAEAAQRVACECVVFAETKDHADWELIGQCAAKGPASVAPILQAAYERIENEEDMHLYHTKGWCRELWLEALELDPVLPPPEERLQVRTAIGAARAQASVRAARRPGDTKPASADIPPTPH